MMTGILHIYYAKKMNNDNNFYILEFRRICGFYSAPKMKKKIVQLINMFILHVFPKFFLHHLRPHGNCTFFDIFHSTFHLLFKFQVWKERLLTIKM